ncbi:Transposase and inactivated derivatives [Actinomyces bovis]|uniref:Transposase and inactivated derivatives n=1 Tax=Actinomyces bovis TaxID=1658 RepID=A0ABY1VS42_9ACTO|nr:Transposase and inactivated derivatives [Actinomyces bovis]VEG56510.1 Transposase and inactivated derivatives [Actinomyces israelii]
MTYSSFRTPDLSTFTNLDQCGLAIIGQQVEDNQQPARLLCRPVVIQLSCPACGTRGYPGGTTTRQLSHIPWGHRPTILHVVIRRYRCPACETTWRDDLNRAAPPRSKLTYAAIRWALVTIGSDHMTISRCAAKLQVAWHTVNTAVLDEGRRVLFDDPQQVRWCTRYRR